MREKQAVKLEHIRIILKKQATATFQQDSLTGKNKSTLIAPFFTEQRKPVSRFLFCFQIEDLQ